jgi:RimJ/RimL family protein N-acetyltransferase
MPGPAFATGERVSLHPIEEADHEFLQYGRNHPSTRKPLTNTSIRSRDDVADRVENADHHYLVCATAGTDSEDAATDRERVGVVAFTRVSSRAPRSGSLMYWVAPEHRREGYISEATALFLEYAFAECGIHKVTAQTLADNEASVAALESLGFEREGRLRDEEFVAGEPADTFRYALLADDWLN